ncbi:MAG: hypothetical protein K6E29_06930 [Cyanobacteria bacterium RUI128]|nr:hypothetical protein [Cyanobacteria bacterium RUI128]
MNRISAIIPRLKFSVNIPVRKSAGYSTTNVKTVPNSGVKSTRLYSRKISRQTEKPDVFVSETREEVSQNLPAAGENSFIQREKTPKKSHHKPVKEALAKYFDNDNPANDYLNTIDIAEEAKTLEIQNKKLREVKDAEGIRKFVERNGKEPGYEHGHGFDNEALTSDYKKEIAVRNKALEKQYAAKTKEYFDENPKTNNYLKEFAEEEEKETAERLKKERLDSIIEPYADGFNPRSHKIKKPVYPYDYQNYKDNHNKVQRSGKSLKFY